MAFKFGKNFDEMCYPFMYESSSLCDFEVITDELCGHIGAIISHLPDNMPDIATDLEQIQPLAFHINGSIRGRLAVSEEDQAWLQARLNHYKEEVADRLGGFVLPRGTHPFRNCTSPAPPARKPSAPWSRSTRKARKYPCCCRACAICCATSSLC